MPDFCTCGAQLPPDARFCHKCGKPQYEESRFDEAERAVAPPVVAAPLPPLEIGFSNGIAVRVGFLTALIGVLLAMIPLPFTVVRLIVCFVAAGFLAVYLYRRRTGQKVTVRGGARMGYITGIFSFTIFVVQLTAGVLASSSEGGFAGALKQAVPANDARTQQMLEFIQEPSGLVLLMVLMLFLLFIILTLLPTIGGALGAKVLTRE